MVLFQWHGKPLVDFLIGSFVRDNASHHELNDQVVYLEPMVHAATWQLVTSSFCKVVAPKELVALGAHYFSDPNRLFLFRKAKPALKTLLTLGIEVARPLCLRSVGQLISQSANTFFTKESPITDPASLLECLKNIFEQIEEHDIAALARLECLVQVPFAHLEHRGLYLDTVSWRLLIQEARDKMTDNKQAISAALAGSQFVDMFGELTISLQNGNDTRVLLEQVLGQPILDTSSDALRSCEHPFAGAILRYREAAKLWQCYGDSFLQYVDCSDSRVRAQYESSGTSSGRVACHSPNLQNLPSDARFHNCVRAPKGRVLVTADYATCELRVLAALAQDAAFLDAINSDLDFHSEVAKRVFKADVSKTTNVHLRQHAKAISFGLVYGMGVRGLASTLKVSESQAQEVLHDYFRAFPTLRMYLDNCVESAQKLGYSKTHLNRKYWHKEPNEASGLSTMAKNMPIQGSAAEVAKLAMIRVHERLKTFREAFLVNMIHDELVVECDQIDADNVEIAVQQEMELALSQLFPKVRPVVDVHAGPIWKH